MSENWNWALLEKNCLGQWLSFEVEEIPHQTLFVTLVWSGKISSVAWIAIVENLERTELAMSIGKSLQLTNTTWYGTFALVIDRPPTLEHAISVFEFESEGEARRRRLLV
jgi:hypothetical protein